VLPEGFFRYVTLSRVAAYVATGGPIIGVTLSPHDGQQVAIVKWPAAHKPLEPGKELAACPQGGVWVGVRAGLDQSQFLYAFVLFAQRQRWTLTPVNSTRQIGFTVRLRPGTKCQLTSIVHFPY